MKFSPLLFTVDHITPISKGGTNKRKNLLPACTECNTAKADLYIDQFRKLLGGKFKFYFEEIQCGKKLRQL
jgi:5-methylcytosine-specific restriction endonuclease McrA